MKPQGNIAECTPLADWGGFCAWAFFGAVAAFGLLVLGSLAVLPILLGVWLAVTRPSLRRSWFGVMTGVGVTLLYVAYVQRRGPGTTCWHTATAAGCDQYLNPLPWLVAGAALVVLGFIAQARRTRACVRDLGTDPQSSIT
jgi:type IV secretory pathway TrbL component